MDGHRCRNARSAQSLKILINRTSPRRLPARMEAEESLYSILSCLATSYGSLRRWLVAETPANVNLSRAQATRRSSFSTAVSRVDRLPTISTPSLRRLLRVLFYILSFSNVGRTARHVQYTPHPHFSCCCVTRTTSALALPSSLRTQRRNPIMNAVTTSALLTRLARHGHTELAFDRANVAPGKLKSFGRLLLVTCPVPTLINFQDRKRAKQSDLHASGLFFARRPFPHANDTNSILRLRAVNYREDWILPRLSLFFEVT
ncbi:hypothetical protein DFH06DRAFT_504040 [Mycena polygramma]|nr:hypothetical protein DFH06DRAFT_504040 [Mycena polygramma]